MKSLDSRTCFGNYGVGAVQLFAADEFIIFHYWTAGGEKSD
jgi:hypothetical protein